VYKNYFLNLTLKDNNDKVLSTNFYWLSRKKDVPLYIGTNRIYTPILFFADYKNLQNLAPAKLQIRVIGGYCQGECTLKIKLENKSDKIAFMIRLRLLNGETNDEVLPVIWEDNFISLVPWEKRTIKATFNKTGLGDFEPIVEAKGWNTGNK
jgi:exo-1,4-beta-D-glucosaminidase